MRAITYMAKIVDKRWGREIWFANNEEKDYCGKILEIDPDNQLSLHFHMIKEEHLYNMKGDCQITWLTQKGEEFNLELQEGESFHIKPGVVHRFSTKGGCTLLEASTFHRDSDSYRVSR